MSILYYDPFTEFDRLFDDAFATRFLPATTFEPTEGSRDGRGAQRRGPWRPRLVQKWFIWTSLEFYSYQAGPP